LMCQVYLTYSQIKATSWMEPSRACRSSECLAAND